MTNGQDVFAGADTLGVFRSTDDGKSWISVIQGDIGAFNAFTAAGRYLFVGNGGRGVFRSADGGSTWTHLDQSPAYVWDMVSDGMNIFVGSDLGVFRSTDNGDSWIDMSNGLPSIWELTLNGSVLFAGAWGLGVYRTTDNGISWDPVNNGITTDEVTSLLTVNGVVFAGTYFGGMFRSNDNGDNWTNEGLAQHVITDMAAKDTNIFVATGYDAVFHSTDFGETWADAGEGLIDAWVDELSVGNDHLFAGTWGGTGVWKRPLSEFPTMVNPPDEVPAKFHLSQNFPNPFNSISNFEFRIANLGHVTLKVYDLLGREVGIIVNEKLAPGSYMRQWDAAGLASGVYLYRLTAGEFVQTRKLLLLR